MHPSSSPRQITALDGHALQVINQLEHCFLTWAEDWGAESMQFSPLLPVDILSQWDYLRNFPHLGLFTTALTKQAATQYADAACTEPEPVINPINRIPQQQLSASQYVLPSAICYGIYLHLQGQQLAIDRLITTAGQCFRNEAYYVPLERQQCFTQRDIVCVGSEAAVNEHLDRSQRTLLDFAEALGLPVEWKVANDLFFDQEGVRAKMQRRFKVKKELVYDGRLALASVNYHLTFFGERCQIMTAEGQPAFSGCVGMGLERWLSVLLERFNHNVPAICAALESTV